MLTLDKIPQKSTSNKALNTKEVKLRSADQVRSALKRGGYFNFFEHKGENFYSKPTGRHYSADQIYVKDMFYTLEEKSNKVIRIFALKTIVGEKGYYAEGLAKPL